MPGSPGEEVGDDSEEEGKDGDSQANVGDDLEGKLGGRGLGWGSSGRGLGWGKCGRHILEGGNKEEEEEMQMGELRCSGGSIISVLLQS